MARTRKRFCAEGLVEALRVRKGGPGRPPKIDGTAEAHLVVLACTPPEGRAVWTTRLLTDRYVELGVADGWLAEPVSRETVRLTRKKALRPHRVKGWLIPRGQDAAFVAAMDRVLDVYAEPHDATRPVVDLDERPCALVGKGRQPLPMRPGADQQQDHEYVRGGLCCALLAFEPLQAWRQAWVRPQRRRLEFAAVVRELCDEVYPDAVQVRIVCLAVPDVIKGCPARARLTDTLAAHAPRCLSPDCRSERYGAPPVVIYPVAHQEPPVTDPAPPSGRDMVQSYDGPVVGPGIAAHGQTVDSGLRAAMGFAEMIVDTVREGLLVLDLDLRVQAANESFYRLFGATREQTEGRLVYELGGGVWDRPELRVLLERVLPERHVFDDFEVEGGEGKGRRVFHLNGRQLNHHRMVLLAATDVTERVLARQALELAREDLERRVEARTQEVRELATRLTVAEQAERQRIAQVLHDDLQQRLFEGLDDPQAPPTRTDGRGRRRARRQGRRDPR